MCQELLHILSCSGQRLMLLKYLNVQYLVGLHSVRNVLTAISFYVIGSYNSAHISIWMKMENKFILLISELTAVHNSHLTVSRKMK